MNKLQSNIEDIRKLFFISVDNDITDWYEDIVNSKKVYKCMSFEYNTYIYIDLERKELKYHNGDYSFSEDIVVGDYTRFFWVHNDKRLYNYVKKLYKHVSQVAQDKKDQRSIKSLKKGLDFIQKKYPKEYEQEIRKEKLKTINK